MEKEEVYNAVKKDLTNGLPLVVLINQGSALPQRL